MERDHEPVPWHESPGNAPRGGWGDGMEFELVKDGQCSPGGHLSLDLGVSLDSEISSSVTFLSSVSCPAMNPMHP